MSETDRLERSSDWIDLGFIERERTPREIVEVGIQLHRRGRFKVGWNRAVDGAVMGDEALAELTWENLGLRLGMIFGEAPEELKEELYRWCVKQQLA